MKNEVRTTKDEGGIVIGQDILDMMADAGKRHESLKSGHLRVIVGIEGGDVPKGEAGAWFSLVHYGVYADGQNFARYAKGLKSTDDIAAALREGFVDPREYKWKRASRAKKAADWVANFLPYAAMLAIGIMASRCLFGEKTPDNLPESDPERTAQHLASEAVEVPHEPSTNAALPPVERGVSGGSDAGADEDGLVVPEGLGLPADEQPAPLKLNGGDGVRPAELHGPAGGPDSLEEFVVLSLHAEDDSTRNQEPRTLNQEP